MRIDVETFLTLTVLMGTGVAVGVGVMTARVNVDDVSVAASDEPVVAPTDDAPVDEAPPSAVATPAPTTLTPVVPAGPPLEPPIIPDPEYDSPDGAHAVPGPDVEG